MSRCRSISAGAAALALLLAGCGNRPAAIPRLVSPAPPPGFHLTTYGAAGLRLAVPLSWTTTSVSPPQVTVLNSGEAVISLWRYRLPEALPTTPSRLERASRRLIAAALRREPEVRVLSATLGTVNGHPSVDLYANERIGAIRQRVRSIHVFTPTTEVVLEEYAPPSVFDRVDRQVFEPVRRSLIILAS